MLLAVLLAFATASSLPAQADAEKSPKNAAQGAVTRPAGALPSAPKAPGKAPLADNQKPREYSHKPDMANVAYGPHERNVLDLWKAKSDRPTPLVVHFHGGGFTQGDKTWISPILLEICLKQGISVATANYRYSTQAPYPAQLEDSARAVQFLRLHAKEYNLDPNAVAITGGSAGGVISMWLGFFDDMADPANADPVKRQTTRVSVIGPVDGQSTLDPRVASKLIGEDATRWVGTFPASRLFGLAKDEDLMTAARVFPLYEEASPINHVKAGAPPVIMYYNNPPGPLPPVSHNDALHNFRLGTLLKERLDEVGIENVLHHAGEYRGQGPEAHLRDMVDFFVKHFPRGESR
ncbi:MAG: alpha/beta hydrolase [Candidatus Sumerlaeota bacterium]|nr:alpha/beta hydrolase [Candidatus Sumerlaeota bacterium]